MPNIPHIWLTILKSKYLNAENDDQNTNNASNQILRALRLFAALAVTLISLKLLMAS